MAICAMWIRANTPYFAHAIHAECATIFYDRDIEKRKLADPEFVANREFRQQWEESIPLGMLEHRSAWGAEGKIGSWVRQHNTVIKINRTLFLHGGISSEVLDMSITEINEQIRLELNGGLGEEPGLSEKETGPAVVPRSRDK